MGPGGAKGRGWRLCVHIYIDWRLLQPSPPSMLFDAFELAVLYKRMPADLKAALLTPYVSIERNEVRLSARVKDSLPNLKRNDLLKEIQAGLEKELDLKSQNFQISGLVVLYNNMLQSLFDSQIKKNIDSIFKFSHFDELPCFR